MTHVDTRTRRHGIIAACSFTVDRIKIIDEWPEQEHLAQIVQTDQQGGGCGHNLAVDVRKLDSGLPVEAIGLIGDDADGEFLLNRVREAGIDTTQLVRTDGLVTSFTDVMSTVESGRRTFFHHPGTHDHVTPEHFDLERCHGKILHLGLLGVHARMDTKWTDDSNGWVSVLRQARSLGIHTNLELVSISAEKIREVALPCLPYLNTLIVNDYELGALSGLKILEGDGLMLKDRAVEAARQALKRSLDQGGALELVVVHSPATAIAVTAAGSVHCVDSFTVDSNLIASTVGAGDAFAAGMLYGIHEGWHIERSMELAHAAAAASLRSSNTVGSVGTVDECLSFARTLNRR